MLVYILIIMVVYLVMQIKHQGTKFNNVKRSKAKGNIQITLIYIRNNFMKNVAYNYESTYTDRHATIIKFLHCINNNSAVLAPILS